ncbi:unnamed protein product [Moneuplotes crassus]|uniref:Uncharacterized protein n=1 Tax=Euplotes crassus TaxID=5936 RepID=A0AAD1XSY3_EUPCR|nr:unnamed protein product [Moneuplotes crassus]
MLKLTSEKVIFSLLNMHCCSLRVLVPCQTISSLNIVLGLIHRSCIFTFPIDLDSKLNSNLLFGILKLFLVTSDTE